MPWEEDETTAKCMHCYSRGFYNVNLIRDTFYTKRTGGFKWFYYDEEGLPLAQPRKIPVEGVIRDYKPHTTINKDGVKVVGLLTRLRCPHYKCKTNDKIRERAKESARKWRNRK